ncbi:MAG: GAF domain-containing protein [Naasia sp.]
MTPALTPGWSVDRVIADRYELRQERGRGPRSVIFEARDRALDRRVIVKVFLADALDASQLRIQEAEVLRVAGLEHPALTRLFDAGIEHEPDGRPFVYLVSDHNDGADLRDAVAVDGMPEAAVAHLGQGLAEALAVLHSAGLPHGNITPSNILLRTDTSRNRAHGTLTELEIGYLVRTDGGARPSMTRDESAPYLSPERRDGGQATPESDIFALGVCLAFAMQATTPRFTSDGLLRLSVSTARRLAAILRRMTAESPSERPSAAEAAALLGDFYLSVATGSTSRGPSTSAEETAREAARVLEVLDHEPGDFFDRLTRLATSLTGAPISFLSFVTDTAVIPRGMTGMRVDGEFPPEQSICTITAQKAKPWAVADIWTDPATSRIPVPLTPEQVTSYAAAPLITHDGRSIGSLCVYTRERRDFSTQDLADLADLAAIATRDIELTATGRRSSPSFR